MESINDPLVLIVDLLYSPKRLFHVQLCPLHLFNLYGVYQLHLVQLRDAHEVVVNIVWHYQWLLFGQFQVKSFIQFVERLHNHHVAILLLSEALHVCLLGGLGIHLQLICLKEDLPDVEYQALALLHVFFNKLDEPQPIVQL
jgi:hypothetical protein